MHATSWKTLVSFTKHIYSVAIVEPIGSEFHLAVGLVPSKSSRMWVDGKSELGVLAH